MALRDANVILLCNLVLEWIHRNWEPAQLNVDQLTAKVFIYMLLFFIYNYLFSCTTFHNHLNDVLTVIFFFLVHPHTNRLICYIWIWTILYTIVSILKAETLLIRILSKTIKRCRYDSHSREARSAIPPDTLPIKFRLQSICFVSRVFVVYFGHAESSSWFVATTVTPSPFSIQVVDTYHNLIKQSNNEMYNSDVESSNHSCVILQS